MPGFFEIDLVGLDGGDALGEHAYTLTATDAATGRPTTVRVQQARFWVVTALGDVAKNLPFPVLRVDSARH